MYVCCICIYEAPPPIFERRLVSLKTTHWWHDHTLLSPYRQHRPVPVYLLPNIDYEYYSNLWLRNFHLLVLIVYIYCRKRMPDDAHRMSKTLPINIRDILSTLCDEEKRVFRLFGRPRPLTQLITFQSIDTWDGRHLFALFSGFFNNEREDSLPHAVTNM